MKFLIILTLFLFPILSSAQGGVVGGLLKVELNQDDSKIDEVQKQIEFKNLDQEIAAFLELVQKKINLAQGKGKAMQNLVDFYLLYVLKAETTNVKSKEEKQCSNQTYQDKKQPLRGKVSRKLKHILNNKVIVEYFRHRYGLREEAEKFKQLLSGLIHK